MDAGMAAFTAIVAGYVAAILVIVETLAGLGWRVRAWTGVVGVAVSALASLLAASSALGGQSVVFSLEWLPSLGISFSLRVDALSALMGLIVAILSLLIALYSVEYIGSWGAGRYWVFFTFFVASMLLLVYADDLVTMFIGWEGTGLASWALIGFYYDDREEAWVGDPGRKRLGVSMWFTPTHSALRAISFTRVGDIGMLIGIGVLYTLLGSASVSSLAQGLSALDALAVKGIMSIWLILFYLGALAKSAQFPFHEWLVTAMTGPTSVSALIHAATMVKAGVYFALRLTPILAPLTIIPGVRGVYTLLAWLSLLTAFATATMAIVARELKLVLAYSTASQLSYMLAAVFAATAVGYSSEGVFGGFAHLISHAVFKAALFLVAGAVIHAVHSRYMDDMGGLKKYMKLSYTAFLLAALSLAALPPFSGWWSKDAAVHAISLMDYRAALVALIVAVLTATYTARTLYYVFLGEYRGHEHPHEPGILMLYPYLLLGLASLGLGLAWPWIEHYVALAAGLHHVGASVGLMVAGTLASILGLSTLLFYTRRGGIIVGVEHPVASTIRDFLYDRWLVNAVIYRLIVYPARRLAEILFSLEKSLDMLAHEIIPFTGLRVVKRVHVTEKTYDDSLQARIPVRIARMSSRVRSLHTGDIRDYVLYFALGIIIMAFISLIAIR